VSKGLESVIKVHTVVDSRIKEMVIVVILVPEFSIEPLFIEFS
jgi:hypothetical protein